MNKIKSLYKKLKKEKKLDLVIISTITSIMVFVPVVTSLLELFVPYIFITLGIFLAVLLLHYFLIKEYKWARTLLVILYVGTGFAFISAFISIISLPYFEIEPGTLLFLSVINLFIIFFFWSSRRIINNPNWKKDASEVENNDNLFRANHLDINELQK